MFHTTTLETPDEFGNASDGTDIRSNSVEIPSIQWWHVKHIFHKKREISVLTMKLKFNISTYIQALKKLRGTQPKKESNIDKCQ
jgi:hypothetical protein